MMRLRELRRFLMVLISNNYKSNKKHHLIRTSDSSGDAFLLCIYYIINDCYPDIQSIESLAELYGVSLNDLLNKNPDDYLKKFNPNALVISLIISGLIVSIIMILKYTVFINVTFESVYMEDLAFSIFVFMFIMFTDINFGIFKKKSIKITLKILLIILDIFYLFF